VSQLSGSDVLRLRVLHLLAQVALRACSPLGAKALVDYVGCRLMCLRGAEGAQAAVRELVAHGSCLSRALAVAAALPGAEVVIGVDPWRSARIFAHAWLEVDGVRVDTNEGTPAQFPDELGRLPSARSSRELGL
jgi:hypothetical protein